METIVEVSRKYGEKKVNINIYQRAENTNVIVLAVSLDDFIDALIKEVDSVTWVFTKAEFEKRMLAAKNIVIDEIKKTTVAHAHNIPTDS